jgi:RND family efflux transporter MFP subunit
MKGTRIGAVVATALLVVGLAAVRTQRVREKNQAPTLGAAPVAVEDAAVRRGAVQEARRFLGEVVASEEAPLAARILSQVIAVSVREGDGVRRGQRLVELDPRELEDVAVASQAAVAAAVEGVAAAESAYQAQHDSTSRDKVLADARAISREQWERSEVSLLAAKARLEAARAQLTAARRASDSAATRRGYAVIQAPFDGVVSARYVNPGDLAAPGKPLVAVVATGGLRVRVKVPAETVDRIAIGRPVRLDTPAGQREVKVSRVFPSMDASHLATFEADLPAAGSDLIVGSTVPVEVPHAAVAGLLVPADALLENENGTVVFTVAGGKAHLVRVHVMARSTAEAAVSGEVRDGDRVVVGRPSRLMLLAEGTAVQVAESARAR